MPAHGLSECDWIVDIVYIGGHLKPGNGWKREKKIKIRVTNEKYSIFLFHFISFSSSFSLVIETVLNFRQWFGHGFYYSYPFLETIRLSVDEIERHPHTNAHEITIYKPHLQLHAWLWKKRNESSTCSWMQHSRTHTHI